MANTPPNNTQFAIPNFNNTTNTLIVNGEPGTWQCIATGQQFDYMNGTYTTTGSHFFTGGVTPYGSFNCFGRNGLPNLSGDGIHYYGPCWESRSGSNNYAVNGVYQGTTSTIVSGSQVLGEYVSITSPYGIILKSYSLISSNYNGVSTPASGWVIAGSNDDGMTYTTVDIITNNPLPLSSYGLFNVSNTISYTTYIIIITNITNGTGASNIGTWNIYSPATNPTCFKEDTRILCLQDNIEKYIPIQHIKKGDLVKTINNGYLPADIIGKGTIYNSGDDNRINGRLYKYSKKKYSELNDDLIITGFHSVLVDKLTEEQKIKTKELLNKIFVTDGKYRLMSVIDENSEPYNVKGLFNIYHIALENTDYYMNYGIYANGMLVESCSQKNLKELSKMTLY